MRGTQSFTRPCPVQLDALNVFLSMSDLHNLDPKILATFLLQTCGRRVERRRRASAERATALST